MKSLIWMLLLITGSLSMGGVCRPMTADETESILFYYENDIFAGTDQNYSNAVKFSWVSADLDQYDELGNLIPDDPPLFEAFLSRKGMQRNLAISLGQNIYTPEDTDTRELIEDDRPYAGVTYVAVALHRKNEIVLDTLELNLGIVGPASLAEDSQRYVHEITGSSIPRGWDNQLQNEFGFALTSQRSYRIASDGVETSWGWDLIPHAGLTAGTFAVYANAGAEFRFGYHVPSDFGTALVRPGGNISVPAAPTGTPVNRWHPFSIAVFLTTEGRAVAHNIFLDGNTWKDSHSVDKEPFVADFTAGVSVIYNNFKLTYAHVYRTREFEIQEKGHSFGSVSMSFIY